MFKLTTLLTPKLPDPVVEAAKALHEARLDLLNAQAKREYWQSMTVMLETRINRLRMLVKQDENL